MRRLGHTGSAPLGFLLAAAAVSCWVGASELVALQYSSVEGPATLAGLENAARVVPHNWQYDHGVARLLAAVGKSAQARQRYLTAIESYPGCAACWVGVAEMDAALKQDPLPALGRAVAYGRASTPIRTRAAVLYAKLGMDDLAAREFGAAVGGRTKDRQEFYRLLARLYSSEFVLEKVLLSADLPSYFRFARREMGPDQVMHIWDRMQRHNLGEAERMEYVDYLIGAGYAHAAWSVAYRGVAPALGTVVAGDFESVDLPEGLDWRIRDGDGVRARVSFCADCRSGSRALRLRFDGDHNPNYFGTSISVPVRPGATYRLRARVKYEGLTSAKGPSLMVRGLRRPTGSSAKCELRAGGEDLIGDSAGWEDISVVFAVPPDCEGIRLVVARPATKKLNRYIGGELWIDDVQLGEVRHAGLSPAGEQPTEPASIMSSTLAS